MQKLRKLRFILKDGRIKKWQKLERYGQKIRKDLVEIS